MVDDPEAYDGYVVAEPEVDEAEGEDGEVVPVCEGGMEEEVLFATGAVWGGGGACVAYDRIRLSDRSEVVGRRGGMMARLRLS